MGIEFYFVILIGAIFIAVRGNKVPKWAIGLWVASIFLMLLSDGIGKGWLIPSNWNEPKQEQPIRRRARSESTTFLDSTRDTDNVNCRNDSKEG